MTEVEQWLVDHSVSTNYENLVERLRSEERVECLVTIDDGPEILANTELFKFKGDEHFRVTFQDRSSTLIGQRMTDGDFIDYCEHLKLRFATKDFLKSTRKLLEIAKNAAEFHPVFVPLNTIDDVDALLALIDANTASG
ncbi:MAG: hypothetical protein ACXWAT_00510 [Methylobacter sp.]